MINESDRKLTELYRDFLPAKVFDAHMHLYTSAAIPKFSGNGVFQLNIAKPEDYMADMQALFPGVEEIRLNMLPFPDPALNDLDNGLRALANDHIVEQIRLHPQYTGAAYALPGDGPEKIGEMLSKPGITCLKPYYFASPRGAVSTVAEFLPENIWAAANTYKAPIILHMMRQNLADAENFSYIDRMTAKYPDTPVVLAHCARAFAGWTAVREIPKLADRENIWFDLSAICETGPMMAAILKTAGKRTMWGSDWPVCLNRGRPISLVDDQHWLLGDQYAYVGAENLFAFYQTALLLSLDATQVEDIFYNNANRLFSK